MRFSVIIPAYNEERYLPRLLNSINVARANYSGGDDEIEVIVADNDSTDRTSEVATAHGARVVHVAKRRIGAARNGGARIAGGEILCFIDADFSIHPQTFEGINEVMTTGHYVWGATSAIPDRWSLPLFFTYCVCMSIVWITRLDTGLSFCRREDFEEVGGYDEARLYAEDVKFPLALRRLGRKHGQRLVRIPRFRAVMSTRKFDQFGDWHYFGMMAHAFKSLLTWNWHDEELAERYWYNPGR
jgi:glycosyltransferase involved in cell wall biosynthesis